MFTESILQQLPAVPVMPFNLSGGDAIRIDLSPKSSLWDTVEPGTLSALMPLLEANMQAAGAKVCVGGYFEHREMYRRSALFDGTAEPRNLHLGIDIWHAHAGVEVYAVLPGKVHSFANNIGFGNYGPTIILEHNLQGMTFYTLYGHLSLASLEGLRQGDAVQGGQRIAWLGGEAENGNWPPHLHFQCMTNMLGMEGDFPGVCASGEREKYEAICFNPNYFLKIPALM